MNKFNLTFSGEILDGHKADEVKASFARLFAIDDPRRIEQFFSGETIVLRRNLNRQTAAEYFLKTRNIGAATELVKAPVKQPANDPASGSPAPATKASANRTTKPASRSTSRPAAKPATRPVSTATTRSAARVAPRPDPATPQSSPRPTGAPREQATLEAEKALRERARRVLAERERQAKLRGDQAAGAAVAKARKRLAGRDATQASALRELKRRQEEEAAQFWAVQERVRQRAAERLTESVTPRLANRAAPESAAKAAQRQQGRRNPSDPPNVFALRPFRNTARVKTRGTRAQKLARSSYTLAVAGALLLTGLAAYRALLPEPPVIRGVDYAAVNPRGDLLLAAGEKLFLHDRSGVGERILEPATLGLSEVSAPLLFTTDNEILLRGKAGTTARQSPPPDQLFRCDLVENQCQPLHPETARPEPHAETASASGTDPSVADAFEAESDTAITDHPGLTLSRHPRTGELYLADPGSGRLQFLDADGVALAWVIIDMPQQPALRMQDGLLLMNSASGPAISVFRLEAHALGQQLDEILLMPAPAADKGQSRVGDFVWSGDRWWVLLYNPETGATGLYQFDAQWNFLRELPLARGSRPRQLVLWGSKVLARDAQQTKLQRFGEAGQVEVPLSSDLLTTLLAQEQRSTELSALCWKLGLVGLSSLVVLALLWGHFNQQRSQVYRAAHSHGAEPVDKIAALVRWVRPSPARKLRLQWLWLLFTALSGVLIITAIAVRVAVPEFGALLIVLGGLGLALYLLSGSHPGHIGVIGDKLLLVDHRDTYHLGRGDRVEYHTPFVLIDDVVVFTGTRWLPWFDDDQLRREVVPVARAGVRINRASLLVRLLQNLHPLAGAALIALTSTVLAALVLLF